MPERDSRFAWLGRAAFALAVVSSLLYYAMSDEVRFFLKAFLNRARDVMVGA